MSRGTTAQPKIRVFHCHTCGTMEELPDFDGPPQYDTLLEFLLSQHETNGHRHIGKLYDVEERVWQVSNLRDQIIESIKGGSKGLAAFDPAYYDTRDTFKEDALLCYNLHLRPQEGCSDWKSDRKRLLPATKADRKEVGLDMSGAPVQYLCRFCPVSAYYEKKERGD
jgi:hypothetical protein